MLRELWIEDLALIEKAHLELDRGFTVLTGETGSGKSLLVGALDYALGARARADAVRRGASRAYVAARFEPVPPALDAEAEEGALLITRTIESTGKSKATLNDRPVTLSRLRQVGGILADLHGQHEQQSLLKPEAQRSLLDAYAQAGRALEANQPFWLNLNQIQDTFDKMLGI